MAASTPASARTTSTAKRAAAAALAASSPSSGGNPSAQRPRRAAHDKNPFSATKSSPTNGKKPSPAKKAPPANKRASPPDQDAPTGCDAVDEPVQDDPEPAKAVDDLEDANKDAQEQDGRCPACSSEGKGDDGTWVECDKCEKWYHWSCVAGTSSESPETIDKWYCSSCIAASASSPTPLKTTYKPSPLTSLESSRGTSPTASTAAAAAASTSCAAPSASSSSRPPLNPNLRKSSRSTRAQNIDYANLDQHLPASVDRWIKTISAREASGQIVDGFVALPDGGGFRRFEDGRELSAEGDEWVYGDQGMTEPFVVDRADGLGLQMPPRLTVKEVAELVGPTTALEVIDCASQSSLSNWTLGQWADYYEDPRRDKVRNVISLEVSESRLGEMVRAPELVRKLDWVDTVWPDDMKVPGQYPRVQKYCLMSVEKCWTDWHVDFAGSSVFYHVLRGGKTFFFIRPTPANLKAYEEWSGSSERQESTWLGDMVDRVYRMDLKEGNTAFIPTGWIHAVYTPADSLVIGGNFLHSLNITTQLRVYNIELATKVPRKFRYPHFVKLLWLVGKHYYERYASHPAGEPLPLSLRAPRVLEGLKELSSFLIEQTTRLAKGAPVSAERRRLARENIPSKKIPDPVWLSREFRKVVLKARGEPFDAECFLPHVAFVDEAADASGAATGTKRKADSLEPDANAALAALSKANKMRRPSSAAPPAASAFPAFSATGASPGGDGEIIGRQTLPVQTVTRTEERIDPRGQAKHGALHAEVRESRSTQSVIRRWEHDPLDPTASAGAVVETRTVITIVERVRFLTAAQAKLQAQQRKLQPYAYPAPAQPQLPGIGPPAPQSITAVPGTPLPPVAASNPQPYQPYGWPYQYQLTPAAEAGASAAPLPPPGWSLSSQGAAALPNAAPSPAAVGPVLPPLPSPSSKAMPPPPLPRARPPSAGTGATGAGVGIPTPLPAAPNARMRAQYASSYPPPPALAPASPAHAQGQGYALPLPVPPPPQPPSPGQGQTPGGGAGLPQIFPAPPSVGGGLGMLTSQVLTLQSAKTALFWFVILRQFIRVVRHLRARGLLTVAHEAYLVLVRKGFACMLLLPSVRAKVQGELDQVTLDLERKLAPKLPNAPTYLALPEAGLSAADVSAALTQLSELPRTEWEGGRVSGAVYHGGKDMGDIWREAFGRFEVSNPLHADVFPGVRKMDSEVVSMCLSLYNAPLPASAIDDGGAGTTTSGGTESILMACKAYRDRARAEFGITEPEMIVSKSAHAAFDKAGMYFGIKIHHIPVDRQTRKVQIAKVRRAINANTILLVGSAPNFPDGAIDDIAALSDLAVKHRLGLHVDCCLGSFLVPFLERAGFPTVPFDFRVPGVTSISCDTHKYGFSPKGSSCIMYRSKSIRKYQYSVTTTWPGGVYATPSMSGSRPGAIIAGAWASLVHMGIDGYTASCREIVGAAKRIAHGVRKDFPELYVLGDPLVSVVAFASISEGQGNGRGAVPIYEVGDRMSKMGWHLNALQDPPALHIACTRLTVPAVDDFLRDLRTAVDEIKALEEPGKGSMVMLYGLGTGSAVGGQLIGEMASRYMDVLYA